MTARCGKSNFRSTSAPAPLSLVARQNLRDSEPTAFAILSTCCPDNLMKAALATGKLRDTII